MAKRAKSAAKSNDGLVAANPKARHDFAIEDVIEAGLMLQGSEVKSMRHGGVSIKEAYVGLKQGQLHVLNMHIPEWRDAAHGAAHTVRRPRKLLLHRREHGKLLGAIERKGYTLVALKLYFNAHGIAKLAVGLAKGKTKADKRESDRTRDWNKQKAQLLKRGV